MIPAVAVVVADLCPARCLVDGVSLDGEGGGSGRQGAVLGLLQVKVRANVGDPSRVGHQHLQERREDWEGRPQHQFQLQLHSKQRALFSVSGACTDIDPLLRLHPHSLCCILKKFQSTSRGMEPCAQVCGHYLDAQKQPCHELLEVGYTVVNLNVFV